VDAMRYKQSRLIDNMDTLIGLMIYFSDKQTIANLISLKDERQQLRTID